MNLKALILAAVVSIGFAAGANARFVKVVASGSFSPNPITNRANHPNFDSNADWSLSFVYDTDAVAEPLSTIDVFRIATAVQDLDLRLNNQPVGIAPDLPDIFSYIYLSPYFPYGCGLYPFRSSVSLIESVT